MKLFTKKMPEAELVMDFINSTNKHWDEYIDAIVKLFKESLLISEIEPIISGSDYKNCIGIWKFATDLLPLKNVFQVELGENIYEKSIIGVAMMRHIDESQLRVIVKDFIDDFRKEYDERPLGRTSQWLISSLYGDVIYDPSLLTALDLYIAKNVYPWREINKIFKVIPFKK